MSVLLVRELFIIVRQRYYRTGGGWIAMLKFSWNSRIKQISCFDASVIIDKIAWKAAHGANFSFWLLVVYAGGENDVWSKFILFSQTSILIGPLVPLPNAIALLPSIVPLILAESKIRRSHNFSCSRGEITGSFIYAYVRLYVCIFFYVYWKFSYIKT